MCKLESTSYNYIPCHFWHFLHGNLNVTKCKPNVRTHKYWRGKKYMTLITSGRAKKNSPTSFLQYLPYKNSITFLEPYVMSTCDYSVCHLGYLNSTNICVYGYQLIISVQFVLNQQSSLYQEDIFTFLSQGLAWPSWISDQYHQQKLGIIVEKILPCFGFKYCGECWEE